SGKQVEEYRAIYVKNSINRKRFIIINDWFSSRKGSCFIRNFTICIGVCSYCLGNATKKNATSKYVCHFWGVNIQCRTSIVCDCIAGGLFYSSPFFKLSYEFALLNTICISFYCSNSYISFFFAREG